MFDPVLMNNLQQALGNNLWPTELINCNYKTHLLHQAKDLLGTNGMEQYSLMKASRKKWSLNGNDPNDNEYELPILKYDANHDKLVKQKKETPKEEEEGTTLEEEKEPETPLQLAYEEGEDSKSSYKECIVMRSQLLEGLKCESKQKTTKE